MAIDLEHEYAKPWDCPRCRYHNDGYKGFCGGCRYQRGLDPSEPDPLTGAAVPPELDRFLKAEPRSATGGIVVLAVIGLVAITSFLIWRAVHRPNPPRLWPPRIEPIAGFVERTRGVAFRHPVPVQFLSASQFKAEIGRRATPTAAERRKLADTVRELRALGLVSGDPDLAAQATHYAQDSVLGFYNYKDKRVYVRGDDWGPEARVTLAHELTHALQDQRFGLDRFGEHDDSGPADAYRALFEADAVRVQAQYVETQLTATERLAYVVAEKQGVAQVQGDDVPAILADQMAFPYSFGPVFLKALLSKGGNEAVDAAFARPPASEAEVVDPGLYLSGWAPSTVDAPRLSRGQRPIERPDTFGQVALLEVLGARLGYQAAWDAVQDWAGDRATPYREAGSAGSAGRTCVVLDVVARTSTGTDKLSAGLRQWAASMPKASVTRTGQVIELRSCDPGAGFTAPHPDASPFEVLLARGELVQVIREETQAAPLPLNSAIPSCVADRLIAQVGPSTVIKVLKSDGTDDPEFVALRKTTRQAALDCHHDLPDASA